MCLSTNFVLSQLNVKCLVWTSIYCRWTLWLLGNYLLHSEYCSLCRTSIRSGKLDILPCGQIFPLYIYLLQHNIHFFTFTAVNLQVVTMRAEVARFFYHSCINLLAFITVPVVECFLALTLNCKFLNRARSCHRQPIRVKWEP